MSLATRCPHCQTAFQVTESQLKSHSGMVTCGMCKKSFNAIDELIGRVLAQPENELSLENTLSREEKLKDLFNKKLAPLNLDLPKPKKQTPPATVSTQIKEPILAPIEKKEVSPAKDAITSEEKKEPVTSKETPSEVRKEPIKHEIKQPSATPKKRSSSFWWWFGSLVLLLILIGQGVYFYSEKIVSSIPATKNTVTSLCHLLNCPVKKIVVAPMVLNVKPGELKKSETQPNTYSQTIAITNTSDRATAWPILALEIVGQDNRILSKQYITPARYLPTTSDTPINVAAGKTELVTLSFDFKTEDSFTTRISIVRQPSL